jgi:hypothetical protein
VDDLCVRFGQASEAPVLAYVATGLRYKEIALGALGRLDEQIVVAEGASERIGEALPPDALEQLRGVVARHADLVRWSVAVERALQRKVDGESGCVKWLERVSRSAAVVDRRAGRDGGSLLADDHDHARIVAGIVRALVGRAMLEMDQTVGRCGAAIDRVGVVLEQLACQLHVWLPSSRRGIAS